MLHPRYPIETTRLHLRPLVETDFEDFYAYDSSPEVARYLYWEPRGLAESRETFERHLRRTALEGEGDALVLAIVWREVGKVVGHVSLGWVSSDHQSGEIGFIMSPPTRAMDSRSRRRRPCSVSASTACDCIASSAGATVAIAPRPG